MPTTITFGSDSATATAPTDEVFRNLSASGFHVAPPSVVFQRPPPVAPKIVDERLVRQPGHRGHAAAPERADVAELQARELLGKRRRGGLRRLVRRRGRFCGLGRRRGRHPCLVGLRGADGADGRGHAHKHNDGATSHRPTPSFGRCRIVPPFGSPEGLPSRCRYRNTARSSTSSVSGFTVSSRTFGPSTMSRQMACWVEKPLTAADHGVSSCA